MNSFEERIRDLAPALLVDESHVEKDWHVVRALGVIATVNVPGVRPAFSGGTSLASAWRLINRFSEDIDFKVIVDAPTPSAARSRRSRFRESVLAALGAAGFEQDGDVLIGNMSRFFRVSFRYGAAFPPVEALRPAIQIEMTFGGTLIQPVPRVVQSLLGRAAKSAPEVAALLCVDPLETAADKISALAWRAAVRDRSSPNDDRSIVRHLHDLAALAPHVRGSADLPALTRSVLRTDAARTRRVDADGMALLREMLPTITADPAWRDEYELFVRGMCFGPDAERIAFDDAVAACQVLVTKVVEA